MSGGGPVEVVFPASADGRRSTSAVGRAVVADALRGADPAGAGDAERDTNWRQGYVVHFRRLVEAGLASKEGAVWISRDGLESLHGRMRVGAGRRRGDRTRQLALGTRGPAGDHGYGARYRAGEARACRCPTMATRYAAMPWRAGWRRG